jgi:hypothetical protein
MVRRIPLVLLSLICALQLLPSLAFAQATPVADGGSVVATGLTNPRGMTWGPDGNIYVALAGTGGSTAATEDAPTTAILGPFMGGSTGAIAMIDGGCPTAVVTGLPSTADAMGEVLGAESVAFLGSDMYVAADGGGPVHGNPDAPSGVFKADGSGGFTLVADLSTWLRANPVANTPPDLDPDADGYRMIADNTNGVLWVLEPNSGGVLSVKPDGTVTRLADLSQGHPVPASIALAPDGGLYIGTLTAVPFANGAAKVMHVAMDGTVTDFWTGLTTVTGLAVGADGSLYALEMSTGNLDGPPFLMPGSGKIVKMTGETTSEDVATGLMFPIDLQIGADGAFYYTSPALGANGGEGAIMRIGMEGEASPVAGSGTACSPVPETLSPMGTPEASPVS